MVYQNYESFIEEYVIPQHVAHPAHIRLDGKTKGSSLEVAGRFKHHGKVWKVHFDTRYEPLLLAFEAVKHGQVQDPFVEKPTKQNQGICLVLQNSIKAKQSTQFKYLFIYLDIVSHKG
jgi:hypothetical protein